MEGFDDKLPDSSRASVTKSTASATVEDSTSRPQAGNCAHDAPTKTPTDKDFPEGGPTAWLTVLGAYAYSLDRGGITGSSDLEPSFFVQACAFGSVQVVHAKSWSLTAMSS